MTEFRFYDITEEMLVEIEENGLCLVEEEFQGLKSFALYGGDEIKELLSKYSVAAEIKDVSELGWEYKWRDYLKSGKLTDNIYYIFDENDFVEPDCKKILINPSLAFGTGNHPTTRMAAQLLTDISFGKNIADVGCGSTILSIAASLSGAEKVFAFDIDPSGMGNGIENIINNKCENISLWCGDIKSVKQDAKFDVICANIISSVILSMIEDLLDFGAEYLVFSGVLKEEEESFLSAFNNSGYMLDKKLYENEWLGVRLKKV